MTDKQPLLADPNDTTATRRPSHYSPSPFSLVVAGMAGYDLRLLPAYLPDLLIDHEHKKLLRIGLSVFIPSFFGFISAYYLFGKYLHTPYILFLSATAFALLLLVVDCIIVTTLSKATRLGLFIRLAMSVCIGIVVSEPVLLVLYEKTINARIEAELGAEKSQAETDLNAKLTAARADLSSTQTGLATKIALLANYSDDKIIHIRALEAEKRKKELLISAADSKKPIIAEQQAIFDGLQSQRAAKNLAIENKLLEMDQEAEGKRGSGKAGRGAHWTLLKSELTTLKREEAALSKQIEAARKRLEALQNPKNEATKPDIDLNARINTVAQLTPEEQTAKTALAADISVLGQKKSDYQATVNRLEAELAGLSQKYAPDTRDDSLTATRVLYQIALENPVLFIKVMALFGLIFFIDTVPTLVKLTVKTAYDDYLRQVSQQNLEQNKDRNHAYDQECAYQAEEKFAKLNQHSQRLTAGLNATSLKKTSYPHERILHTEAYRSMHLLANQLTQPEAPRTSFAIWRGMGGLWTALKVKLGLRP